MDRRTLEKAEEYFLKEMFDGIPAIPVSFVSHKEMNGSIGLFCMDRADDYDPDEDELMDAPGYRVTWHRVLDNTGYYTADDESWRDPLNHPRMEIKISRKIQKNDRMVLGTLLHELMHYWCWHMGYPMGDSDYSFNMMCVERGIPTNYYEREFQNGKWVDTYDYSLMDRHLEKLGTGQEKLVVTGKNMNKCA